MMKPKITSTSSGRASRIVTAELMPPPSGPEFGAGRTRQRRRRLRRSRPNREPDLPLEGLAGRPLRQLVDDPHPPRILERSDLTLDELPELILRNVGPLLQSDRR